MMKIYKTKERNKFEESIVNRIKNIIIIKIFYLSSLTKMLIIKKIVKILTTNKNRIINTPRTNKIKMDRKSKIIQSNLT